MSDKVLIIDDDAVIRKILARMLQITGIAKEPINLVDGLEAYNFLIGEENTIKHTLFLDINMPNMNGWQLLERLKSENLLDNKLIYIITSSVDHKDHQKAEANPHITSVITKPVTLAKLKALVTK